MVEQFVSSIGANGATKLWELVKNTAHNSTIWGYGDGSVSFDSFHNDSKEVWSYFILRPEDQSVLLYNHHTMDGQYLAFVRWSQLFTLYASFSTGIPSFPSFCGVAEPLRQLESLPMTSKKQYLACDAGNKEVEDLEHPGKLPS